MSLEMRTLAARHEVVKARFTRLTVVTEIITNLIPYRIVLCNRSERIICKRRQNTRLI